MKILRASWFRIKFRQVIEITLVWTLVGALDALNTHALSGSEFLEQAAGYSFFRSFWVSMLSATFAGLISGPILVFYLRERFRSSSFGFALLINSLLISALNIILTSFTYDFFFNLSFGRSFRMLQEAGQTKVWIGELYYLKNFFFWTIVVSLTIISLHVNEKYGSGVLIRMLLGRYHNPREEERIFMFVDIKSSTTIAEKLGHIRFFNLLNDFFRDITNSIVYTKGEIYQYVGDEVVISWSIPNGVERANCIRCFYNMQEAILKRSDRYLFRYNIVPEFKAGLHCGLVTIGEIGVIKKDIVYSGDVMNTTSRIQNLCNEYNVNILLSKYLMDKLNLPPHDHAPLRVGMIELKGKRNKIELYTFEENLLEPKPKVSGTPK